MYVCFSRRCAIIAGSYAERMKFNSMLIFMFLWHLIVYCPIAHWEWGGGFMGAWGVLDFAGGDVVHISSGLPATPYNPLYS